MLHQLRLGQDSPPHPVVGEYPPEADTGGAQADYVLHILKLHKDLLQHFRAEAGREETREARGDSATVAWARR